MESAYYRTTSTRHGEELQSHFAHEAGQELHPLKTITSTERQFHAHDAIHSLVAAKLAAYGVRPTEIAGVANEILTLGLEHGSAYARDHRPEDIAMSKKGIEVLLQEYYKSAYETAAFEDYVRHLTRLLFQSIWLEKRIYLLEGSSFREQLDWVHTSLEQTGLEDEETSAVAVEYRADPKFKKATEDLVTRINWTLKTLETLEAKLPAPKSED